MDQTTATRLANDFAKSISNKLAMETEEEIKKEARHVGGIRLWKQLLASAEADAALITRSGDIELAFRQDSSDDFTLFTTERPGASMQVKHDPETQELHWPKFEGFPERAEVLLAHGSEARYHADSVVISGADLSALILKAFVTNP